MTVTRLNSTRGLTLVELLIVLGLISILAAMAVTGMGQAGVFSRDHLQRNTRELYSLLRAARIYAATFNVRTAVVYSFDNYTSPFVDANNDGVMDTPPTNPEIDPNLVTPLVDSVSGQALRVLRAAAMVYELPRDHVWFRTHTGYGVSSAGSLFNLGSGRFAPVTGRNGQFAEFDRGAALLLNDPLEPAIELAPQFATPRMTDAYPDKNPEFPPNTEIPGLHQLGMRKVELFVEETGPLSPDVWSPEANEPTTVFFPAHVFRPNGRLDTEGSRERYRVYMAPSPEDPTGDRLVLPDDPYQDRLYEPRNPDGTGYQGEGLVHETIELFKATGRVRIAS